MTWDTPLGHRKLTGIEQDIMRGAICHLSREIIEDLVSDSAQLGIGVFDALTGCQQLVMLDYVRKYLLEDTPEPNEMSAVVEGTAAALIAFVSGKIDFELDWEKEYFESEPKLLRPQRFWRKLVVEASKELGWGFDPRKKEFGWEIAVEMLHNRILHDTDYLMDFTDHPPETSKSMNAALGISRGYYRAIPPPEPDGPEMLEVIRRLLT